MPGDKFEKLLDSACSGIIQRDTRKDVRGELLDHLLSEREAIMRGGVSEEDATDMVIRNFGDEAEIRAGLARSHGRENAEAIHKGILVSIPVSVVLFQLETLMLCYFDQEDAYTCISSLLFMILGILSYHSAREKKVVLPVVLMPMAVIQCFYIVQWYCTPFVIAVPELLTGHLAGFLRDIACGMVYPTTASKGIGIAFILLYAALNLVISITSFRSRTGRANNGKAAAAVKKAAASMLAFIFVSSALCFGTVFVQNGMLRFHDTQYYHIVPADSVEEIRDMLDFYDAQGITKYSDIKMYETHEEAYVVDCTYLVSGGLWVKPYYNGRFDQKLYDQDNTIIEGVTPWDSMRRHMIWEDSFYTVWGIRAVIRPEKRTGYLVAVPYTDGRFRTEEAVIMELPLAEEMAIVDNTKLHIYEIRIIPE